MEPDDDCYNDEFDSGDPDYIVEMYERMLTRRYEEHLKREQQQEGAE